MTSQPLVWLNGALVPIDTARIAPGDRGFTLGDGLFETLAIRDTVPERWQAHLTRLSTGAAILGLPLPPLDLLALTAALTAANGLRDGVLRLTVTRGEGPRGVLPPATPNPTVLATLAPRAAPLPPARLCLAQVTRRNEHSPLARIKSLNYLDNILARQEAQRRDCDDALLLNTQGRIAESTIANLFAVRDGALFTPPVSEGALPGVMRAELLARGARETPLGVEDIAQADELLLTSSLGIRSVASCEGRSYASFAMAERLRAELA
ncbi:2-keto-4-methylthiobutyrate aminotransferase [Azorhizobium oxalatiphilum]|uniref:Probable branched-chain-amino-acid aminotransferase n=1 Tax=Azorhizobium oxalatiphilum TaxID=980631 RepID=A0A917F7N4_9HYPH|nr:aminotransferase class IV [Azorhizobium oxalatiphilum]GGF56047.1 2-keto-4-methylthiobutyrate aminotransferase [Azorhizobium oxalatiphilum]